MPNTLNTKYAFLNVDFNFQNSERIEDHPREDIIVSQLYILERVMQNYAELANSFKRVKMEARLSFGTTQIFKT